MKSKPYIKYLRILEGLKVAVLVINNQQKIDYLNPAGEMLLQTSSNRVAGRNLSFVLPFGTTLQAAIISAKEGSSTTIREQELPRAGKKDNYICVDCTVSPLIVNELAFILIELSRVDRITLIERNNRMQERQKTLNQMLKSMAHEIRNPLGGIRGAAQLLETELSNKDLNEYTRIIMHEADRLKKLLDRLNGGSALAQPEMCNMHVVLEHVRRLILAETPDGIEVKRDYDPSIPDVFGDRSHIIQVILNIMRNAVQAMHSSGEICLRTRVLRQFTLRNKKHRLVVQTSIIDNGPGVDPKVMDQMFYPMVTGRADGTGLGLSVAQDIIQNHNGLIECNSEPGQTNFSVYLPVRQLQ
tara:strand:+ start:1074 stop:2141 length:1068 start_codon:yes stop_codon:yes gene_type:complete